MMGQILEEDDGFEIAEAESVEDGLEIIRKGGVDLVISDLVMPGKTGIDMVEILRLEHPGLRVILITGHGTVESAVKAMKLGALDYIRKISGTVSSSMTPAAVFQRPSK
jgi:two-component system nitrogen regulation response regulator NtrX